jgi:hypothetical protein
MATSRAAHELGSVDKFDPASRGGEVYYSQEGFGELIVTRRDGTVDLEAAYREMSRSWCAARQELVHQTSME